MQRFLLILITAIALVSCTMGSTELAQDTGILPSTCGNDGACIEATIDGTDHCGSAQVIITGEESIVTGVDLVGNTLIVQADELLVGNHEVTDASNGLLYMQSGTPYVITPGDPGTLTITQVDTTAHVLKGSFNAHLHNEMSGSSRHVAGSFDVVYTVEQ